MVGRPRVTSRLSAPGPRAARAGRRRWWPAFRRYEAWAVLVALAVPVVGAAMTYVVAVHTAAGQRVDAGLFVHLQLRWLPWNGALGAVARVALPLAGLSVMAVLAVLALVRRRGRAVAAAVLTVVGSAWLVQWLQDVLPGPEPPTLFPSGHAAAGLAAVVGVLLLWPALLPRWLVVTAGLSAAVMAVGGVASRAHLPSEIAGAAFVVLAVAAATCALVRPPLPVMAPGDGGSWFGDEGPGQGDFSR